MSMGYPHSERKKRNVFLEHQEEVQFVGLMPNLLGRNSPFNDVCLLCLFLFFQKIDVCLLIESFSQLKNASHYMHNTMKCIASYYEM